ncbi:(R,S)-reticuline 7-O-methyltransferase [Beta vulgaris subsp. vulgaris]|nr:(R,S)-reticuline 7-O-methyltransferase [Beta vulgaris subsp. vulgaris]
MPSNELVLGINVTEDAEILQGQAEVHKTIFAYIDSLVLRSAVELRIADIIYSHGQAMSLSQIALKIDSPSLDIMCLERVMRMLVRKKIFTAHCNEQPSGETLTLYGLTTTSKWLLHDQELSLAPTILTFTDLSITKPAYEISRSIKEGGIPFVKAHGESIWEMASNHPEFNSMFNSGMAAITRTVIDAVIKGYKDGFSKLEGSLVDIGGGTGKLVANIVKEYPHLKGINFDLSHVVENAPLHYGVTHVGGDMFKEIPSANNIILKNVLHNWTDEDCLKILKNCQKAVSEKKGKVIIVEVILRPERHEMFDDTAIALDILMMTNTIRGKERTEDEWMKLLKEAAFTSFNIIPLQSIFSIIEATS